MALSEAAKEAMYLQDFLEELELNDGKPLSLGCDNQAAGDLAYNPEHHQRTKHIARRHFFVREAVEDLHIVVPFVATADNMADFFTKPLPSASFFHMRNMIRNVPTKTTTQSNNARAQHGGVLNTHLSYGSVAP